MSDDKTLLIVEDDPAFAPVLRRSFERRGYVVQHCDGIESLRALLETARPGYAVVDLKVVGGSGLECVRLLHERDPETKIVVLTGFASIATAVEAIKLGPVTISPSRPTPTTSRRPSSASRVMPRCR